jgi:hypothetical protein
MRLSLKESRRALLEATNLDRKSGIRGPKKMGEALQLPFLPGPTRCSLGRRLAMSRKRNRMNLINAAILDRKSE